METSRIHASVSRHAHRASRWDRPSDPQEADPSPSVDLGGGQFGPTDAILIVSAGVRLPGPENG